MFGWFSFQVNLLCCYHNLLVVKSESAKNPQTQWPPSPSFTHFHYWYHLLHMQSTVSATREPLRWAGRWSRGGMGTAAGRPPPHWRCWVLRVSGRWFWWMWQGKAETARVYPLLAVQYLFASINIARIVSVQIKLSDNPSIRSRVFCSFYQPLQ
jgi:hypothetical protein